jgi:hypothetical protein
VEAGFVLVFFAILHRLSSILVFFLSASVVQFSSGKLGSCSLGFSAIHTTGMK